MNHKSVNSFNAQRLDEWKKLDAKALEYHQDQWAHPKESTLAFENFISKKLKFSRNIIDLGAGAGASTAFLAAKYQEVNFTALDYSDHLIVMGRNLAASQNIFNLHFEQGNWYDLKLSKNYDGCISLQTLSWLPDYQEPLIAIFEKLDPEWIALTSLFYEGDITCKIEVDEHTRNRKGYYNIYSLPAIDRLCAQFDYKMVQALPFVIQKDLDKPINPDLMSTYTKTCLTDDPETKERIQISGPLLMNWYMILIERIKK